MFVFGTRPEAIKMMPIILKVNESTKLQSVVAVTAQHRQMLDQVLELFHIQVDYDMGIMRKNQSLSDITINVLHKLEVILNNEKPDLLMVQGDTTTTFIAGLAAFYKKIPIAHVEAGLRTFNKYSPFPEEINRRLISPLADLHFPPTELARQNLLAEGIADDAIEVSGNSSIDALFYVLDQNFTMDHPHLMNIDFNKKTILVTAHRRESFGAPFENICLALADIAQEEDVEIIYPVHLNPNIKNNAERILGDHPSIHLIEPVDYKNFVLLMNKAYIILSDSGGIQEEAPSLGKPILVLREVTERQEGIEAGTAKLVGRDRETIVGEALALLRNEALYESMAKQGNPYGDGKTAERIVNTVTSYFNELTAPG